MIIPPIESTREIPTKAQGAVGLIVATAGLALAHHHTVSTVGSVIPYSLSSPDDMVAFKQSVRDAGWLKAAYHDAGAALIANKLARAAGMVIAEGPTKSHRAPGTLDEALDGYVTASVQAEAITHTGRIRCGQGSDWTICIPGSISDVAMQRLLARIEQAGWVIRTHCSSTIWLRSLSVA